MCLGCLLSGTLVAQNRVEYFWNTDPGVGKGTLVTVTGGTVSIDISTGQLPYGANLLGIRALNGQYASATMLRMVFKSSPLTEDARAEYFWDEDPGLGQATALPISCDSEETMVSFTLPTEGLSDGVHLLGLRVGNGMHWSQTRVHMIGIAPQGGQIDCIEYFWDEDPGLGQATRYPIQASGNEVTISFDILTEGLERGVHTLGIRSHCGGWSQTLRRMVVVGADDNPIEAVEYFWDEDPGYGQATPLAFTGGNVAMVNQEIDTPSDYGTHMLLIRAKAGGMWGTPYVQYLCINADPDFDLPKDTVCVGEQFIVTNLTTGATEATTYSWDMNNDGIADYTSGDNFIYSYTKAGNYIASLAVKTVGTCETTIYKSIVVLSTATPSVTLSASAKTTCDGDSIRFAATPANAGGHPEYEWLINGNVVATGTADTLWVDTLADYSTVQVRVISSNPCSAVDNALSSKLTIRVNPLPEVTLEPFFPVFTSESAFILEGGYPEGGIFAINGKSASLFNPQRNTVGTYQVTYSYTDGNGCTSEAVRSFVMREGTLLTGDVNKDEVVDIMDILCAIDLIYGRTFPTWNLITADVSGDSKVDVADVVGISSIILGPSTLARVGVNNLSATGLLTAEDAYADGVTEVNLHFNIGGDAFASGVQFDVKLPEGVELQSATAGLTVAPQKNAEGNVYTLLAYSKELKRVSGKLTVKATLPVNLAGGAYDIVPTNTVMAAPDMHKIAHEIEPAKLYVGGATGLDEATQGDIRLKVEPQGIRVWNAAGGVLTLTDDGGRFVLATEIEDDNKLVALSTVTTGAYVAEIVKDGKIARFKLIWK